MADAAGQRLLVVDDEPAIRDLVATALRFMGYSVDLADDGAAGWTAARGGNFVLLILDVNLPGMDGFELCRRLRAEGNTTPVIFLTARGDPADLRTGFSGGGDDYVTKPFSLEELSLRVEAVLRRAGALSPAAPRRLIVGPLVIDEDAVRVSLDGETLALSPTEFRLLHYLASHRGRVLSKAQILDQVWQYDFGGDDAAVETYVSYLRRKLGPHGSLIRTVRGFGYAIDTP